EAPIVCRETQAPPAVEGRPSLRNRLGARGRDCVVLYQQVGRLLDNRSLRRLAPNPRAPRFRFDLILRRPIPVVLAHPESPAQPERAREHEGAYQLPWSIGWQPSIQSGLHNSACIGCAAPSAPGNSRLPRARTERTREIEMKPALISHGIYEESMVSKPVLDREI